MLVTLGALLTLMFGAQASMAACHSCACPAAPCCPIVKPCCDRVLLVLLLALAVAIAAVTLVATTTVAVAADAVKN